MSVGSRIPWTDATWNPITGCTKVSPGCAHCYIERTPAFRIAHRRFANGHIPLQLHADRLEQSLHWRTPRRIFVNSLSDLFHEDVPDDFLHRVYHVMEHARQHTFQVLTKRPNRMLAYLAWRYGPREDDAGSRIPSRHIWHGVSVEQQRFANERIPLLLQTPSAIRFVSAEPLLGPVSLEGIWGYAGSATSEQLARWPIHWVIIGGESGPTARIFDVAWARSLVRECQWANVPIFVKQLGSNPWDESEDGVHDTWGPVRDSKGGDPDEWPPDLRIREYPNNAIRCE